MNKNELITISKKQLQAIWTQLKGDLAELNDPVKQPHVPGKVRRAVQAIQRELHKPETYEKAREISHTLGFLRLAAQQRPVTMVGGIRFGNTYLFQSPRPDSPTAQDLNNIEELIKSCYEPFEDYVVNPLFVLENPPIPPDQILAIYFQSEYLARPKDPVPFIIVPNYYEPEDFSDNKQADWIGVAHEVGHHVYRQVPCLREELEVTLAKVLQNSPIILNPHDPTNTTIQLQDRINQQRLWFHYLEETFADLVGVMSLGAAFVYSQHVIILGGVQDLLIGQDLTHPIPLLRGQMGASMYERLVSPYPSLDKSDRDALLVEWNQVIDEATNHRNQRSMPDPHKPESPLLMDTGNSAGTLDIDETFAVMHLVIDTLLNAKLRSLGNKSLSEVVANNFSSDEQERSDLLKNFPVFPQGQIRNQIAARRLAANQELRSP